MDEEIVQAVIERSKGLCEVCYREGRELHHIVKGNGKRKQHESPESIMMLCIDCHRGSRGIHGRDGHKLDLKLKRRLQEEYSRQGYTEDEVRAKMGGKLY